MSRHWTGLHRRRAGKRVVVLALLALVARALVPTGFMPVTTHGTTQMMFCHGDMALLAHDRDDSGDRAPSTGHQPCVYAASAGGAPLPATIDLNFAHAAPTTVSVVVTHAFVGAPPVRHAAPRGPPSLV